MADEPTQIVREFYAAVRHGDVAAAQELTAEDFEVIDHADGAESAAGADELAAVETTWKGLGLQPEEYRLRHHRVVVPVVLRELSGPRIEYHVWDVEHGALTRLRIYADERTAENAAGSVG